MPDFSVLLDECRADHPEVVAELERLRLWVQACIGSEVAEFGGQSVEGE